jgi:protein TonB
MEAKKILSSSLLDIIFDDRNKAYGAYDLRATYPRRVKKSLLIAFSLLAMIISGIALANSLRPKGPARILSHEVTISDLPQEEKEPEPLPEKPKQPEPQQVKSQAYVEPRIVPEDQVDKPPPTQEDLKDAKIDVITQEGIVDDGTVRPDIIDDGKNIIAEPTKEVNDEPFMTVEIDAKFEGNWNKFLLQNLNPNVPVDNGAPTGRYTVLIQFVVDLQGNVSDIKPLTSHGYGMEQEAVRVLKRAKSWVPAVQNGIHVKAYRKQPITFEVLSE